MKYSAAEQDDELLLVEEPQLGDEEGEEEDKPEIGEETAKEIERTITSIQPSL